MCAFSDSLNPFFFCENPAYDLPGPSSVAKAFYSNSKPAVFRLALNGYLARGGSRGLVGRALDL